MTQINIEEAKISKEERFLLINKTEEDLIKYIYDKYYIKNHLSMEKIGSIFGLRPWYYSKIFKKYNLPARSDIEKGKIYSCNENFFALIDTEEKAYWLGFMYADGYIQSKCKDNNRRVGLSLSISDIDHLHKFKDSLESNHEIKIYKTGNKSYSAGTEYCRIIITEEKMVKDLISHGCVEHKTNITTFPSEDIVPQHLQRHFIRGYFDGDGSIWRSLAKNANIKTYSIDFCGTDNFLSGLMNVLIQENVINREYKFNKRKEEQIVSCFRFGGNSQVKRFCEYIYNDSTIYLQRKYDRYQDLLNVLNSVIRINKCCVCGTTESSEFDLWTHGGEYDGKILCHRHYQQLKRHGKITRLEKIPNKDNTCIVCGDRKATNYHVFLKNENSEYYGKTVCRKHYDQLNKIGHIKDSVPANHKTK